MTIGIATDRAGAARRLAWTAILAAAATLFSLAFACATPFAALAALAAIKLRPREGLLAIGIAWLANQAIGYGVLGYPRTAASAAWGLAIGLAALAATLAARPVGARGGPLAASVLALVVAFAAYEAVLLAATLVLPAEPAAFAPPVLARLLALDAAALAGLLALDGLARGLGFLAPPGPRPARA